MQKNISKILKNSAILLSGDIGANILGLLSISVFTKTVGAELFGIFVLMQAYTEIINQIFNFKTWAAFIKFGTDSLKKNDSNLFVTELKYCLIIDVVSMVLAVCIALLMTKFFVIFFNLPLKYLNIIYFFSFSLLFQSAEISIGIFRIWDYFSIHAKISFYIALFRFILFISVVYFEGGFEYFIYAIFIALFISMLLKIYYMVKILNEKIGISKIFNVKYTMNKQIRKKLFEFIFYHNFEVSIRMISRQADVILLGKLFSMEIVGVYKIAVQISNIIAKLINPLYQAIYPELAKLLAEKKYNEAKLISYNLSKLMIIASFCLYLGLLVFGKPFIKIAFGIQFKNAYYICLLYFIPVLISMISLPVVPILHSLGMVKQTFNNLLFSTIVYLTCVYPLIYFYETFGASVSYIIFYIFWLFLSIQTLKKSNLYNQGKCNIH